MIPFSSPCAPILKHTSPEILIFGNEFSTPSMIDHDIHQASTTILFIFKGMRGAENYWSLYREWIIYPPLTSRLLRYCAAVHRPFRADYEQPQQTMLPQHAIKLQEYTVSPTSRTVLSFHTSLGTNNHEDGSYCDPHNHCDPHYRTHSASSSSYYTTPSVRGRNRRQTFNTATTLSSNYNMSMLLSAKWDIFSQYDQRKVGKQLTIDSSGHLTDCYFFTNNMVPLSPIGTLLLLQTMNPL